MDNFDKILFGAKGNILMLFPSILKDILTMMTMLGQNTFTEDSCKKTFGRHFLINFGQSITNCVNPFVTYYFTLL